MTVGALSSLKLSMVDRSHTPTRCRWKILEMLQIALVRQIYKLQDIYFKNKLQGTAMLLSKEQKEVSKKIKGKIKKNFKEPEYGIPQDNCDMPLRRSHVISKIF